MTLDYYFVPGQAFLLQSFISIYVWFTVCYSHPHPSPAQASPSVQPIICLQTNFTNGFLIIVHTYSQRWTARSKHTQIRILLYILHISVKLWLKLICKTFFHKVKYFITTIALNYKLHNLIQSSQYLLKLHFPSS